MVKAELGMDVTLSPELEEFVKLAVDSGRYRSVSEVVASALRLMREERATSDSVEPLHPRVDGTLAALTRGEGEEGEAFVETPSGELEESQEDERAISR